MAAILDLCSEPLNIKFAKGVTIRSFFAYFSLNDKIYSDIDLTNYTAKITVSPTFDLIISENNIKKPVLTVKQQSANDPLGINHPNAYGVEIYIEDVMTAAVTWRKADYQCFIIAPSGDVVDFMSGQFVVC